MLLAPRIDRLTEPHDEELRGRRLPRLRTGDRRRCRSTTRSPSSSGRSPSSRPAVSRSRPPSRCTNGAWRSRPAASGCSATRSCASSSSWHAPAARSRRATSGPRTRPRRPEGRLPEATGVDPPSVGRWPHQRRRHVQVEAEPVVRVVTRLDRGQPREALGAERQPDALDRLVHRGVVRVAGAGSEPTASRSAARRAQTICASSSAGSSQIARALAFQVAARWPNAAPPSGSCAGLPHGSTRAGSAPVPPGRAAMRVDDGRRSPARRGPRRKWPFQ